MHTASELAPPHADALRLLRTLLQRLSGFRVVLAQHNDPSYRDGLIASLADAAPGSETVDAKQLGDFAAFERWIVQRRESRAPLHLLNLESLSQAEREEFFRGLNYHREHLAQKARRSLVFWLTESGLNELARQAADFWAWREQVLDFSLPLEAVERRERFLHEIYNRDSPLKRQRIAEIEAHLATRPGEPDLADIDMLAELGRLYLSIGDYPAARPKLEASIAAYATLDEEKAAANAVADLAMLLHRIGDPDRALRLLKTEALPVFERLGDVRSCAVVLSQIADIHQTRGELDEASRIRREDTLPVFERLGDVRSRAVTLGQIADIYEARDELDEALRIRRDDELPVYEKLGDVRERAITLGKIADIYQARGDLDEALRIQREDALPVFEKLGDVRERAVTLGKIAAIHEARGEFDAALALHNERLPMVVRTGDIDGIAHCLYSRASILIQRSGWLPDTVASIRADLEQAFAILQKLQRADGIGIVGSLLAQALAAAAANAEALAVLDQVEQAWRKLGDERGLAQAAQLRRTIAS